MHKMQKYLVGLGIFLSGFVFATPTTKVLLTDPAGNRVIEVDGTGTLLWEYSTGLNNPQEAIALTNGNILIADTGNNKIIEVRPGKTIANTFVYTSPVDVKRCVYYPGGEESMLIVDNTGVREVTYPSNTLLRGPLGGQSIREAEKRPGAGDARYLIVEPTINRVRVINSGGNNEWTYSCTSPQDASWTPCDNVLIVTGDNKVIEVKPYSTSGGDIVGTITITDFTPKEAIRMPDGNIMVAGVCPSVPYYQNVVIEYKGSQSTWENVWMYTSPLTMHGFVDVELKGIINVAKILYEKEGGGGTQTTLCGVIVPILQPIIENPFIVATKTVTPTGPVSPGAVLTYKIDYTNTGKGIATNVTIIDQIPEGTVFNEGVNSSPGAITEYSNDGTTWSTSETTPVQYIRWTISTLAPGQTGTVGFQVMVK